MKLRRYFPLAGLAKGHKKMEQRELQEALCLLGISRLPSRARRVRRERRLCQV